MKFGSYVSVHSVLRSFPSHALSSLALTPFLSHFHSCVLPLCSFLAYFLTPSPSLTPSYTRAFFSRPISQRSIKVLPASNRSRLPSRTVIQTYNSPPRISRRHVLCVPPISFTNLPTPKPSSHFPLSPRFSPHFSHTPGHTSTQSRKRPKRTVKKFNPETRHVTIIIVTVCYLTFRSPEIDAVRETAL